MLVSTTPTNCFTCRTYGTKRHDLSGHIMTKVVRDAVEIKHHCREDLSVMPLPFSDGLQVFLGRLLSNTLCFRNGMSLCSLCLLCRSIQWLSAGSFVPNILELANKCSWLGVGASREDMVLESVGGIWTTWWCVCVLPSVLHVNHGSASLGWRLGAIWLFALDGCMGPL